MNKESNFLKLSVCLSCKGSIDIFKENLEALNQQNLSKNLWNLVLLLFEDQLEKITSVKNLNLFPNYRCLISQKTQPIYALRNKALESVKSPLLYFIDEDVILNNKNQLAQIVDLHKKNPDTIVIGGNYINHSDCSFFGKSYNWIASLWGNFNPHYIPGGNLSLKTKKNFKSRFYSPHAKGFGGEDTHFLEQLQKENCKILQIKNLDTYHLTKHSLKEFYKRAFYHAYSLSFQKKKLSWFQSFKLFLQKPGTTSIKIISLSYLLTVKGLSFFYRIKRTFF